MRKTISGLTGVVGLAVTLFVAAGTANANEPYPWCAVYNGGMHGIGATICSFDTNEQCRATVSGLGGFCQTNPMYPGPEKKAAKHPREHY